jgi:exodeoxyribonuclease V gamma subunit
VVEYFTVRHPLQAFSADAFGRGDARRISYRGDWQPAPERDGDARVLPPFFSEFPPRAPSPDNATITRDELYRALANPAKLFLQHRLGLRLSEIGQQLPEVEPFDGSDGLRRHALEQRVFSALTETGIPVDRETLRRRLLAEGRIAPGAAGAQETDGIIDALTAPAWQWRDWARGQAATHRFELSLAGHTLSGALDAIFPDGLLQFRAGKAHGRSQLQLGVDALIWSALGETRSIRRLIVAEGPRLLVALPPDEARRALSTMLSVLLDAREQPLPFMPKAAFAYAQARHADKSEERAWQAASEHWQSREGYGEGQDVWVRLALRGNDPFDDPTSAMAQQFRDLAHTVFDPLLAMNAHGGAL